MVEPYIPKNKLKLLNMDKKGESINDIKSYDIRKETTVENEKSENYGALNTYGKMVDYFKEIYGNENVIFYSYDWRLSIEKSGKVFSEILFDISKNKGEIYIVAHSMGGLVSAWALRYLKSTLNIKLITLGTPFWGSQSMFESLTNSNYLEKLNFGIFDSKDETLKDLVINMNSVYDLLPTKEYTSVEKYFTVIVTKFKEEIENKQLSFEEIKDFISNNFNGYIYNNAKDANDRLDILSLLESIDVCIIAGYDMKTATKVNYYRNTDEVMYQDEDNSLKKSKKITIDEKIELIYTNDGDGSVPLTSATLGNKLSKSKYYFVKETHGGLVANKEIMRFIRAKIDNFDNVDLSEYGYNKSFIAKEQNTEKEIAYENIIFKMPAKFIKMQLLTTEEEVITELSAFREYYVRDRKITYIKTFVPNIKINFYINSNDTSQKYILRIYPKNKYDIVVNNEHIVLNKNMEKYVEKFITIEI